MPTTEITAHLDATPAQVWHELATRFGDLHLWAKGMSGCTLEPAGPVAVGTTRVVKVPGMGNLRETIVAFEPEAHLAYAVTGLPPLMKDVRSDWYLTPSGEGTSLRFVSSSRPGLGPVGKLLLPLLAGFTDKQLQGLVRGFSKHVARTVGG